MEAKKTSESIRNGTLGAQGSISVAYGNIPAPGLGKVRVRMTICARFGCKRQSAGDSRIGVPKNQIFHSNLHENEKNGAEMVPGATKMEPKGCPRRPNWKRSVKIPKTGAERVPEATQMEPKGCPR